MIDQLLLLVRQLTISQRIGIVFGAALTVLMTVGLVMWAGQPSMQAAFTNVTSSDAGTITSALTSAGIPYTLDAGGATISVPATKVAEARIAATQAGYADGGSQGFDLFNSQTLGASAFDQQVQLQRALQGQLANTVKKFDGVADATVTIVFAKTGVTTSTDQPASASVWVKMAGGGEPNSELVASIVSTVAGSVGGLDSGNVSVVDSEGHTLAGPNNDVSTALNLQATTERTLRSKIQTLLDSVLGAGKSQVQVTATLDMRKIDQTTTTVAPIDTAHWTPTGVQWSVETYGGDSATGASGIPGTTSNVPGLPTYPNVPVASPSASAGASASPAATASASPSASTGPYLKTTQTVNYANSTDVQQVTQQPGTILSLSGAVMVDQSALQTAGLKTADLEALIESAVQAPKGAIPVTQVAALAGTAALATTAAGPDLFGMIGGAVPTAAGVLLAAVLLLLVWRNMRALRGRAEEMQLTAARLHLSSLGAGEAGAPERGGGGRIGASFQEELPQIPDTAQARIGERLRQLAEQEPDEVANLVRSMLDDDDRGRRR